MRGAWALVGRLTFAGSATSPFFLKFGEDAHPACCSGQATRWSWGYCTRSSLRAGKAAARRRTPYGFAAVVELRQRDRIVWSLQVPGLALPDRPVHNSQAKTPIGRLAFPGSATSLPFLKFGMDGVAAAFCLSRVAGSPRRTQLLRPSVRSFFRLADFLLFLYMHFFPRTFEFVLRMRAVLERTATGRGEEMHYRSMVGRGIFSLLCGGLLLVAGGRAYFRGGGAAAASCVYSAKSCD